MGKAATTRLAAVLGAAIWLAAAARAEALPEWARKYKTSCVTCHEAFPLLNPVGEAFRLNGYRFPDNMYVKQEPVILGQDAYKKVWPDAIWPSDIPEFSPLAIRIRGSADWALYGSRASHDSLNFFDEMSIFAAGTLGESNSFFMEVAFQGTAVSFNPRLNFEALFQEDTDNGKWLNVSVGFVGDHEIDLPEMQDAQKPGPVSYLKSSWTNPVPGTITDASGTPWTPVTTSGFVLGPQAGLMLYGYQSRFKYALGLVNGEQGLPDRNSRKDGFFQFSYKVGGRGLDGRGGPTGDGKTKEELTASPGGSWVDDSVTFGSFGYIGAGRIDAVNSNTGETDSRDDHFWRWGLDVRWKIQDFAITGGFLLGKDNNPYGVAADGALKSTEYLAEARWFAYPWLIPQVRFEYLNLKVPEGVTGSDIDGTGLGLLDTTGYVLGRSNTIERVVLEVVMLYRANIKISPFAVFYLKNDLRTNADLPVRDDTLIGVALDFAF